MIVNIHGQNYYIDERQLTSFVKSRIEPGLGKVIKIPNGPTIDLSKKSVFNTLIRQVLVFVMPFLDWVANGVGVKLPKRERHCDIIKYTLDAYFEIVAVACTDMKVTLTDKSYVDDLRIITDASFEKENASIPFLPMLTIKKNGN